MAEETIAFKVAVAVLDSRAPVGKTRAEIEEQITDGICQQMIAENQSRALFKGNMGFCLKKKKIPWHDAVVPRLEKSGFTVTRKSKKKEVSLYPPVRKTGWHWEIKLSEAVVEALRVRPEPS